ncbi:Glycine cleavage system T protein (aminomethyltransferase) [Rubrobacter radiotolerans]|uniref:Aminomethyltransferase family protein n=1 Tax=Rubrobacter radiotolerans TaxID=42256 RepID=A0A023X1M0_RUBRA|nr:aminomethyltransferase family protein [Rubrobacter radiotolerans]AHY45915.1 Glycine cleavage system T protein (aminomethyltransferase) [Rubrobacter radiotolerans]MDX5893329.1 aminomethyltransferase family protein [Rubrobacter radiotolerans]SMC03516.1 aminomethyltransferase [Rubrobacter radiotolerans DSM 5868]
MAPERRTPLYDFHLRSARSVVRGGGDYMFPTSYTSAVEEHLNVRRNVGMQDLSTMGEVDVKGPGSERLLRRLLANEVQDMEPGQLRYSTMCNERGGIVDDVTVYKFSDEHFMVVASSGPRLRTYRWIAEHAEGKSAYVTDMTAAIALLSVQGPLSRMYLRSVVEGVDLDSLRFFRFAPGRIGEVEVIVSRSGYTGELGYELYVPADQAAYLWDFVLKSGREYELGPYGVEAMQSLRIEKALPLYGPDISEEYTPFHLGLERFVRLDKRDFVGREALLGVQERGLESRWVGLTLESESPASLGDELYSVADVATFREVVETGAEAGEYEDALTPGERRVGHVSSSAWGPSVGKMLALAHVDPAHAWPGAALIVEVNGRPVPARVTQTPFFDPEMARARSRPQDDQSRRPEPSPTLGARSGVSAAISGNGRAR